MGAPDQAGPTGDQLRWTANLLPEFAHHLVVPPPSLPVPITDPSNLPAPPHLRLREPMPLPAPSAEADLAFVRRWLTEHHFDLPLVYDPAGHRAQLDRHDFSVEDVADTAWDALRDLREGHPELTQAQVYREVLRIYNENQRSPAYVQLQVAAGEVLQAAIGIRLNRRNPPGHSLQGSQQQVFQVGLVIPHAASNRLGLQSGAFGQLAIDDQGHYQLSINVQESVVRPIVEGWLQVSGFLQAGANILTANAVTGSVDVSFAFQASAGAQLMVVPFPRVNHGWFSFGAAASIGVTVPTPADGNAEVNGQAAIILQGSIPGS